MAKKTEMHLSRRERQIMDVIYSSGQASAMEVLDGLPDPPSYSAIRALLRILEEKGHLKHRKSGTKFIYQPTKSRKQAGKTAVKRLLKTFFDDSAEQAVAALLDASDTKLSRDELNGLSKLIDKAKKKGK